MEIIPYIRLIGNDGGVRTFEMRSTSRPELMHEVTIDNEGRTSCSCEDATCRPERRYGSAFIAADKQTVCKHQRWVLALIQERNPELLRTKDEHANH